jgi:hypothetical protein
MKVFGLLASLALASACSSSGVRCDTRLRPINLPQPPLNGLPATVPATNVPAGTSPTSKVPARTTSSPKLPALSSPTPNTLAVTSGSGSPEKP